MTCEVKEIPILFSGTMIPPIQADLKTRTRRLSKQWLKVKKGDILWVRETWGCPAADRPGVPGGRGPQSGHKLVYRANPEDDYQWGAGLPSQGSFVWRPSIHMPRWASRITLEATEDAREEPLRDITEEEAYSEGVTDKWPLATLPYLSGHGGRAVVNNFAHLWSTLHTKPGERWMDSPTVVRVAFRRIADETSK